MQIPVCVGLMHIVQPGESLESIGAKYRDNPAAYCDHPCCRTVSAGDLKFRNPQLNGSGFLLAGQKLYIREFFLKKPSEQEQYPDLDPSQLFALH